MTKRILTLAMTLLTALTTWADVNITGRAATNELFRLERQGDHAKYFISGGSFLRSSNLGGATESGELSNSWQVNADDRYVGFTLPTGFTFQQGDIITVTGGLNGNYSSGRGFTFKDATSNASFSKAVEVESSYKANKRTTVSYSLAGGDAIIGKSSLYVYRAGTNAYVEKVTITRTGADDLVPEAVSNKTWDFATIFSSTSDDSSFGASIVNDDLYYAKSTNVKASGSSKYPRFTSSVSNNLNFATMQNGVAFMLAAGKGIVTVYQISDNAPKFYTKSGVSETELQFTAGTKDAETGLTPHYYKYENAYDIPISIVRGSGNTYIAKIVVAPESVTTPTIDKTGTNEYTITPGTSNGGKAVTVSTYYTTDGFTPTSTSTPLPDNKKITITEEMTEIKVISISDFDAQSAVASQSVSYESGTTDITGATVTLSQNSFPYTGEVQAPSVTSVVLNGTTLSSETDYDVNTIENQTAIGDNYTVTVTGKGSYSGTATATWAITRGVGSISFSPASGSVYLGTTDFSVVASKVGDGTVTYSSSNTGVATIDESTGLVNPVSAGTTTITATVANGTNYDYATFTATYQLTVTASSPVTHTLTVGVDDPSHGTVAITVDGTAANSGDDVADGTSVSVSATANSGYSFKNWGSTELISNPYTFTMGSSDVTLTAIFEETPAEQFVESEQTWIFNSVATNTQYKTVTSIGNGLYVRGSSGRSFSVSELSEAETITFSDNYNVEVSKTLVAANAPNGSVPATAGSADGMIGTVALNINTPGTLYVKLKATNWPSGDASGVRLILRAGSSGDAKHTITPTDNSTMYELKYTFTENTVAYLDTKGSVYPNIYAIRFVPTPEATTYTLTATAGTGGTITIKDTGDNVISSGSSLAENGEYIITANADDTHEFDCWKMGGNTISSGNDDEIVSVSGKSLRVKMTKDISVEATFKVKVVKEKVTLILTAGQSNTDGRVPKSELPSGMTTGLDYCYWSYCNAKDASGTFTNKVYEVTDFAQYSPSSDCGENWGYDAVVYDLVGKALGKNFYVVKQAKGNTGISSKSGGCGLYWSANDVFLANNTSANAGGKSLLMAFEDHIAASMAYLSDKEVEIPFMLWHQGECDSHTSAAYTVYHDSLKAVITHVRKFLADSYGEKYRTLPIICGTVAKNSQEYSGEVEGALYRLQEEDANFHVINMSNGTLLDPYHFDATSAQRLGKKMFNMAVEKELISGSQVSVDDIDATNIYPEGVYNFKVWSEVNLNGTTFTNISLGDTEITLSGGQKVKAIQNMSGRQSSLELNGRFAISDFTPASNAQNSAVSLRSTSGGNCGLRANSGTSLTFSIQSLSPGDAVTITCTSAALKFLSENAFLSDDNSKAAIAAETQVISGTKYIVKSGTSLDFTFGDTNSQSINCVTIAAGEGSETLAAPTITSEMEDGKAVVTITATTSWGNAADIYYTTNGDDPTTLSTKYTAPFTLTAAATTVKAIAVYESLTSDVAEELVSLVEPSAAVTYDFMGAYAADNNVSLAIGTEETSINYIRNNETSNRSVNVKAIGLDPVNGRIAWQGGDVSITDKGLKTSGRAFVIKDLKVGDKIRIEYDGEIYYARSGNYGHSLKNLTTGDAIENMTAYTVNSVDETNNYLAFWVPTSTTISQISINKELTQKVMPTPKIKVKDESTFTYTISYMNGATLYYKKPGDSEYQTRTSGTSIDVQATKLGKIEAYATMNGLTSGTASVTANVPTKAIEDEDGTYDFAKVKEMMSSDYVLGFGDAVTVGGFTLYKPDAVVATTLDQFAFAPKLKADGNKQVSANEWRLMAAGRLRAMKSAIADTLAVLSLTKGQYVTFTYSGGASLKYMSQSTAKLAEGTDVLTSKQAYEVLSDGVLLLTVPADEANYCDITAISITGNEKVTPPTFTARDNANEVTLRLGTSSFGKTVTAYYTTDGTAPTTSSTAVTKTTTIKVDESCTIKAYCVSETGKASTVAEYEILLEASGKSPSVVYDWTNIVAHSDTIKFSGDEVRVVYQAYNSSESTWKSTASSHFQPASSFDNKVSVLNGYKSLQYNNDNQTIRLTQPLAIHNLGVGDEIVIFYSGGDLYSAYDEAHDSYTVDGSAAKAGMSIISGAMIKVTKTMFSNNYIVVTPRGTTNSVTYIQAIYINHATPSYASTPKVALYDVVDTTAIYRFTFSEGTMLHYILEKEGVELQGNNKGTYDLTIGTSDRIKAWATSGTAVSDTLQTVLFAPTPAPSEEGGVDFTEASTDLPADLEVTLDPNKPVTVGGITLYKPTALTAATFDNRFAFTETNKSGKIRIRTNRTLMFAKGDNVNMGLLNLKQGDIVAFEFTGTIRIADGSSLSLESARAGTRESCTRADGDNLMESGSAYVVQKDGSLLLTIELTEASASINKMYVAAVPSKSKAAAIDFATASEEYETLAPGNATGVFYNGKTTAQTFYRLTNETRELPIDGKISTEGGAGEIINSGIKAGNRRIAIHALGKGDEIRIRFYGGNVTYEGHETKGDIVRVNGKRLAPGDTLRSGDVLKVEYVDYLNNYVVLKLDSKVSISGIFINRDEVEKIWMPTIVDQGSNTVLITAGRSSMDNPVSTSYTIDGSEPTERNGTSGPYEEFDVQLLGGNIVTIKAVSYNNRGMYSKVASLVIYASEMTDIPGITVDGNGQRQDVYDLYGRKVESLRRGQIYIVNGKKIFFK